MYQQFVYVEVEENPNCEYTVGLMYKAVQPPQPVRAVRLYDGPSQGEEWEVVGWSSADGGSPVPAQWAHIEDSGSGDSHLIWGGDWGIRLRRPGSGPWAISAADQRGESHFVLSDREDVLLADEVETSAP